MYSVCVLDLQIDVEWYVSFIYLVNFDTLSVNHHSSKVTRGPGSEFTGSNVDRFLYDSSVAIDRYI